MNAQAELEFLELCRENWKQSLRHAADMIQAINARMAVLRREAARANRLADVLAGDVEPMEPPGTGLARIEEEE